MSDKEKQMPEASFITFLSGFAGQVMFQLGLIENPFTKKKEINLPEAKFSIDMIEIFKEKTKGNLNDEEQKYIDSMLHQLRMQYIQISNDTNEKK